MHACCNILMVSANFGKCDDQNRGKTAIALHSSTRIVLTCTTAELKLCNSLVRSAGKDAGLSTNPRQYRTSRGTSGNKENMPVHRQ